MSHDARLQLVQSPTSCKLRTATGKGFETLTTPATSSRQHPTALMKAILPQAYGYVNCAIAPTRHPKAVQQKADRESR